MDRYVQSVIFCLVFAISVWEILCIGPQGTSVIIQKTSSSASLIQQESGQNLNIPHTQNTLQSNPLSSSPNRDGSRDYVNPNRPLQNNPNTQISSQSGPATLAPNRSGSRDYVNPNRPQIGQNSQSGPGNAWGQNQGGSNRGIVRDYVNPSVTQGGNSPQGGQQFRPSPRNSNLGNRDYVNPNYKPPNSQGNNFNTQGTNFPSLPIPNNNPSQGQTSPVSYASKVSGGATTKSPIGQPKPSVLGPTSSSSTTEKSEGGPSDAELKEFSEALLRRDVNNAAKFLTVNIQGKTTSQSKEDKAPEKLLTVQPDGYKIATISKLKLLHNNYILQVNENEHVTAQEKQEENDLLDTMLLTPVMQYTKNFLVSRGKVSRDPKDFKDLLKLLWFNMYSRGGGRIGSSGFEHIFLAELKRSDVSGLHNWVYFDQAENNNIVDYLGYMKKIDLGEKGLILKYHFKLNGVDKPVGSMFIGTSPELEMALYTTCYLFRADKICPLRLNGHNFIIRTFNYKYRGKNMIGSAFPEI